MASHQADVFILEPGPDRYLGRLCQFNQCPKGKAECLVPHCGDTPFLRQHEEFEWWRESLAEGRILHLYDRPSDRRARAADLPLPQAEDDEEDPTA